MMESLRDFWGVYRRKRVGMAGLALLGVFIALSVTAPIIAPHDPYYDQNLAGYFAQPEWLSLFGSNEPLNIFIDAATILGDTSGATYHTSENGSYYSMNPPVRIYVPVEYTYDPPSRIVIKVEISSPAFVRILVTRPDGATFTFLEKQLTASHSLVLLEADTWSLKTRETLFQGLTYPLAERELFCRWENGTAVPISGTYMFVIRIDSSNTVMIKALDVRIYGGRFGLLGTDERGRDIWSQLIKGTWLALTIGILAAFLGVFIGVSYGLVSGYIGGWVDELMMRANDILLAIPTLPLLIVLISVLRNADVLVISALIGFLSWNSIARIARSVTLSLKERTFIEAARAIGVSDARIMLRHILPHIVPLAYAQFALLVPSAVLTEAVLSLLALTPPTLMTWGKMLSNAGATGGTTMWWWTLPPGIFLTALSLSFVFVGHALDEILNPRLRRRA